MLVSGIISLISTRLVLQTLGVQDYGIFSLIVGVVGMLTILNGAMGISTQRFLSHTMGGGDPKELKTIFSTGLVIHFFLAIAIVILFALIGHVLIVQFLNVPIERIKIAIRVFYVVLFGSFFNIITTPFDGTLTARENFKTIAFAEILLSFSLLGSAIFLLFTSLDKLIIYTVLTTVSAIGIAIFKQFYCIKRYAECSYNPKYFNRKYYKEMTSFAGWNLFGALCSLARGHGLAMAINVYFGVAVNAAFGIANQVNGQVSAISSTIKNVIYPQLMKSEGGGDRERMLRLSILVTKIPFIIISLLGVPLIIEMGFVFDLWLKEIPDFSIGLTRLLIILTLISSLSYGLIAAVQSIGKIKIYQIVTGTLLILGLPTAIVFFELKFNVISAIIIALSFEILAHLFRLFFLKKIAKISVSELIKKIDVPLIIIFLVALIFSFGISMIIEEDLLRLITVIIVSSFTIILGAYMFLFNDAERTLVKQFLIRHKNQFFDKFMAS